MINPFAHELVGKSVRYRGRTYAYVVKYVCRNPDGPHPEYAKREWAGLKGSRGETTTAWLDELEVLP